MHQNHGASYNLRPTQRVAMVTLDVTTNYGVMGDFSWLENWIKPIQTCLPGVILIDTPDIS